MPIATLKKSDIIRRLRIGSRYEVIIPRPSIKRLGVKPGEELELVESKKALVLMPQKRIPKDQQWYHTPRWRKMMQEAFDAYDRGQMLGPFDSVEEFKQTVKDRRIHK